jgi:exodeoxyribonuclease-3
MRLVAWNCNMALARKLDALRRLAPDIAVISECAEPARLGAIAGLTGEPVWIGDNPHKGLAVLAFNGYAARLAAPFHATLRHVAPIHVSGPVELSLLAVWAQNASAAGGLRKHRLGPLRRALTKYADFLAARPAIVAGDLNNNVIWHRPGWRINHAATVEILARRGLVSAYHARSGEAQGAETVPTLYWRDRTRDGPTYHIDYIFLPEAWLARIRDFHVGTFDDWCGAGLSDHVPVVIDIDVETIAAPAHRVGQAVSRTAGRPAGR